MGQWRDGSTSVLDAKQKHTIRTVTVTPAAMGLTRIFKMSSSTICPACLKSTGIKVSSYPSSSSPERVPPGLVGFLHFVFVLSNVFHTYQSNLGLDLHDQSSEQIQHLLTTRQRNQATQQESWDLDCDEAN